MKIIGRNEEIAQFASSIHDVGAAERDVRHLISVSGRTDIGKSRLVSAFREKAHEVDKYAFLSLDTTDHALLDPFRQLLALRRQARKRWPQFDTDGFDALALLFDLKFRDGILTTRELSGAAFDPGRIAEDTINDALKQGGEDVLKELQRTGLAPFVAAAASGATLLRESAASMLTAGVTSISVMALTLVTKMVVAGTLRRWRMSNALVRDPEIGDLFAICEYSTHAQFMALMPKVLGRALARHEQSGGQAAAVIAVDPADHFCHPDGDHPVQRLAATVTQVVDQLPKMIVVVTMRGVPATWRRGARTFVEGRFPVQKGLKLGGLPRHLVLEWLVEHGMSRAGATKAVSAQPTLISPGLLYEFLDEDDMASSRLRNGRAMHRAGPSFRSRPQARSFDPPHPKGRASLIGDALTNVQFHLATLPRHGDVDMLAKSLKALHELDAGWRAECWLRNLVVDARAERADYLPALEQLFTAELVRLEKPRAVFEAALKEIDATGLARMSRDP